LTKGDEDGDDTAGSDSEPSEDNLEEEEMAKDIWYKVTGIRWPAFSHIHWYSKYDVFEILGFFFRIY